MASSAWEHQQSKIIPPIIVMPDPAIKHPEETRADWDWNEFVSMVWRQREWDHAHAANGGRPYGPQDRSPLMIYKDEHGDTIPRCPHTIFDRSLPEGYIF